MNAAGLIANQLLNLRQPINKDKDRDLIPVINFIGQALTGNMGQTHVGDEQPLGPDLPVGNRANVRKECVEDNLYGTGMRKERKREEEGKTRQTDDTS